MGNSSLLGQLDSWSERINGWVDQGHFPGGVLDIRLDKRNRFQRAYGRLNADKLLPMELSTVFDSASLTKVVVTLPSILLLAQAGELDLSDSVQKFIPEFRHGQVTLRQCLMHSSGLPADLANRLERYTERGVFQEILEQELEYDPGTRTNYSDIGMILIGNIISRVSGQPLDKFAKQHIFDPLGMLDSTFRPPKAWQDRIAPTEWDGSRYIIGEVHDEKAFRLGGVCGSAGLFTTADDLSRYALSWLYPEEYPLLKPEWVKASLQALPEERGLGWQLWQGQEETLACGRLWSHGTFGHTGFTGCSLWIDPVRELVVVFMTNAVHFGREKPIRQLRPILHDRIFHDALQV
ncbi:CubicO group peptidase (beta-lactamase class C family) [Cohnella lupini]|uniref:CubicO group peptidase (Beta-lactamase class C family) n=1 Tax=Cohnella lupini TaxID=1294267 RepID=A0A3D9ISU6_9BACL|nr:CubicO group peptidase (beta-lactamase class C family) [Cohnella lupini]